MAEAKKGKSWSEMGPREKKAVLVGWAAIVVVAAYFLWPSKESHSEVAQQPAASTATQPPVLYNTPGGKAAEAAAQLMSSLERAMRDGVEVLKAGDLPAISEHSRLFADLTKSGTSQFGSTVFEPLGRCGVAGTYARAWWQAQLDSARHGGQDPTGAIKSALDEYQMNRTECLKSARSTG